jgi:hypothetical protein
MIVSSMTLAFIDHRIVFISTAPSPWGEYPFHSLLWGNSQGTSDCAVSERSRNALTLCIGLLFLYQVRTNGLVACTGTSRAPCYLATSSTNPLVSRSKKDEVITYVHQ